MKLNLVVGVESDALCCSHVVITSRSLTHYKQDVKIGVSHHG